MWYCERRKQDLIDHKYLTTESRTAMVETLEDVVKQHNIDSYEQFMREIPADIAQKHRHCFSILSQYSN